MSTRVGFTCEDIIRAAGISEGRKSGHEILFTCPKHDDARPSLSVNPVKDKWLCGPCSASGTAWQLAAFLADISRDDKEAVNEWLRGRGFLNSSARASDAEFAVVAKYAYTDEEGGLLYEVVRYEPKTFRQRRPNGRGDWVWNMDGVRRVPYRLPELRRAVDVFVVEGEKDADNLARLGLIATTMLGGTPASASPERAAEFAAYFEAHQHVVVLADNDEPGRQHAERLARALQRRVKSVRLLNLPWIPEKGDVSDWLGSRDQDSAAKELCVTADRVPEWKSAEEESPASFIDWAPEFLDAEDQAIIDRVNELIPPGVCCLWHGEPRTRKTWAAGEIVVAFTTGTPAFGLKRFSVPTPGKALYLSQEDGERLVRIRFRALLRARGLEWPKNLGFAVHKGIDLESVEWHARLIEDVRRHGIQLVVFDPIRRFAMNADKGPAEVRAITAYLRELCTETGCSVLIVHHDVKPPAIGQDTRRRGHRASGGDWFASSEAPISFEIAGENQTVCYPESFKLSSDPVPFTFRLETDDPRNPTEARLIGENTTTAEAATFAVDEAVLTYLASQPGASGNKIQKALQKGKGSIADSLERLFQVGRIDCVEGKQRAKLWTIRPTSPTSPHVGELAGK